MGLERVTPNAGSPHARFTTFLSTPPTYKTPPSQLVCFFAAHPFLVVQSHHLPTHLTSSEVRRLPTFFNSDLPIIFHFFDLSTTTATLSLHNGAPAGLNVGGRSCDAPASWPSPRPHDHEHAGTVQLGHAAAAAGRPHQRRALSIPLPQSIRLHLAHPGRGWRRDAGQLHGRWPARRGVVPVLNLVGRARPRGRLEQVGRVQDHLQHHRRLSGSVHERDAQSCPGGRGPGSASG